MLDLVPWATVVVLATLMHLQLRHNRRKRKERAEQDSQRALEQDQQAQQHELSQRRAVAKVVSDSDALIASTIADARAATAAADARAAQFQQKLGRSIEWEHVSRQLLIAAAGDVGVDGVLATNVTFVPREAPFERPFVAQIDHILLTETFAMIVENKHWRGLVFDGRVPSSVHPAFGLLLDESSLGKSFAVQMAASSDRTIDLLVRSETETPPRVQVRRQAARFKEFAQHAGHNTPWLHSCVLYSHSEAHVFVSRPRTRTGSVETSVATSLEDLRHLLATLHSGARGNGSPLSIAPLLEQLGADMYGLGQHAERWTSLLPATYRTPARHRDRSESTVR